MYTITLKLHPDFHEATELLLQTEKESGYYDIPTGKEVVFNNKAYYFTLPGSALFPAKVFINDEAYDIEMYGKPTDGASFQLRKCEKPFLESFGAIKIEIELDGKRYYSNSIAVMVSDNSVGFGILDMIEYIYNNCEDFLYEENRFSSVLPGMKNGETVSLESKIRFLQEILDVYKQSYQYLKTNPYSKLEKTESIDPFDKLQSVSQRTIQYITNNIDELAPVNYDTGIRFNNQFYQPNRVLAEHNYYSYDVYENRVIIGFLKTLVTEINSMTKNLQEKTYLKRELLAPQGYIDSMYRIFSRSIKKIGGYIETLKSLQNSYRELYYFYSKLFNISADMVTAVPAVTPVFRAVNAYRQIYLVIQKWFRVGSYDLGKDELLLSFISTSKIYEYYCLIKMLCYISNNENFTLLESKRVSYPYYSNNRYNNTFIFKSKDVKLTLFFQPVVYGDSRAVNGLNLFRNTTSSSKTDSKSRGRTYTPDYIIKAEHNGRADYLILDAKFSEPNNIRLHQLQELVYKYLFSISPLNDKDRVLGLYIICGKKPGNDEKDVIHDLARNIGRSVMPFAEILSMSGMNTDDRTMAAEIIGCIK